MERLTMTDAEMREIGPVFNCPVKAEDLSRTQEFCDRVCDEFQFDCPFQKMAMRLKKYEDLEEQGLLLRLPFGVGDAVDKIFSHNEIVALWTAEQTNEKSIKVFFQ